MNEIILPDGWSNCALADIAEVNPKKIEAEQDIIAGFVPMSHAPTNYNGKLEFEEKTWGEIGKSYTNFKNDDVIFAKVTPCFENGKAAIVKDMPNNIGAGSSEFYVLRARNQEIPASYLLGIIKTRKFMQEGAENMTGAVGLRRVPRAFVESFPLILPPLAEQKIIADKLDILLAQVDSAKARLEQIPQILKRFRQAVLAAAVSGKLTVEWRQKNAEINVQSLDLINKYWENIYEKNGKRRPISKIQGSSYSKKIPKKWLSTRLGQVFDVFVGATPSRAKPSFWNGNIPWVSSSEVAFCKITKTKEAITELGLDNTSTSVHPVGTVMLAMIGQGKTRGQAAILEIEACHNQNTAALRVPEGFALSEYLYYFLVQQYEETRRIGGGNNQQALNKSFVQSMGFPLPPIEEQTEIVRRVEQLFAYADTIEKQVQNALECVNNLTQSILAKAFSGELTAQWRVENPDLISGENSAQALLVQIQQQRSNIKTIKRGKGNS